MSPAIILVAISLLAVTMIGFTILLRKDMREIQATINARLAEALNRIEQLDEALRRADITPPKKPNKERY